jgi:hypothetical protein
MFPEMKAWPRGVPARLGAVLYMALASCCLNTTRAIEPERASPGVAAPLPAAPPPRFEVRRPEDTRTFQPLPSESQSEDYRVSRQKSVVELQQFRETTRMTTRGQAEGPVVATLIDLNPRIGTWYLLRVERPDGPGATYHLESPTDARLRFDPSYSSGIVVEPRGSEPRASFHCELWPAGTADPLADARESRVPYAPLCGGMLYLRNPVEGHRTPKEAVVDLLRDHVWQGDEIAVLVRDVFYRDAYLATSNLALAPVRSKEASPSGPSPPRVSRAAFDRPLLPVDLQIGIEGGADRAAVGRWYPAVQNPGIFVTTLRPDLVSPEVVEEQRGRVAPLDPVESVALVYLVAFDLEQFDLGFRLGTDHPRVGWSDMVLPPVRDDALAGPDGIATVEPLVRTGILSPTEASRVAATFTGGFKRAHGAFRMSELATASHGSHYGFIENGVVLSKLQPGLATVVVFDDGRVDLRTWAEPDDALLPRIRDARQNGVAIVERDAGSLLRTVPGSRVRDWGAGNWSGSADRKLRTLRAGLCLQESQGKPFLLYGYFSSATPSAMARVFQACDCRYAMLLDMNALEHTYMAVYRREGPRLLTEHLIDGMGVVDGSRGGQPLPRFVSVADNRDFFYLLRRTPR